MLPVASASAEVRSGSVTDPTDATLHQNVDGTSYRDQDIQRITASYDTAGSITMVFYFLDPVPTSTPDELSASLSKDICSGRAYAPAGSAGVTVRPSSRSGDSAFVTVSGYGGSIQATRTLSADHRAIIVHASAAVLANRDYTCVGLISLSHDLEFFHCNVYADPPYCSDYLTVTTDETDAFSIDAATPAFPVPEPEAAATPTPTPTSGATSAPTHRCVAARNALRTKQKQLKKLKAQRRSAHKRKRKAALARKIDRTRRSIVIAEVVIDQHC
jgi:hypothetical protein